MPSTTLRFRPCGSMRPAVFLTGLRYGVGIGVVSAETVLAGASDDLAEVMAEYSLPVIPVPEITASWRF